MALRRCAAALLALLLASCAVGPNYQRPKAPDTPAYKEENGWKPSEPADALSRGPWWSIFHDATLDELEAKIDISNENVKAALASYEQARALVQQAQSGFWPTLSASFSRQRGSQQGLPTETNYNAQTTADWTIDVWGQVRRSVESNQASAQASAAQLAAVRLSSQATLATDYFELRAQDQLQQLLNDTVAAEQLSLKITQSRYRFGVAAKADVVSAQAQLLSSEAQQVNAQIQRALLEHAIAVLIGLPPADFSLSPAAMRTDVPTVPAGVPSTLLERRPDVAEAERKVAAANAQIGVATSAYFPTLTLSGSYGYSSPSFSNLISLPNRVWSLGPALAQTLFDGGLRRSQVAQARAAYDSNVANYRQTVLASFEQVEDQIATLRILEQQAKIEDDAVKAAREAEALTLNQYKAGTVPYSSVITAQTTRLSSEETALSVLSSRLQASVALIQALGGGWNANELPH